MKLHLIRHGRTQWNHEERIQGSINQPLDDVGRQQIHDLAIRLKDVRFDKIYSSPLDRARESALILSQYFQMDVAMDAALREASFGAAEGLKKADYHQLYAEKIVKTQMLPFHERIRAKIIPDGESQAEVATRIIQFLENLAPEWMGKQLLVVCHGAAICSTLVTLFELDTRLSIENAGYVVLEYSEGRFTLQETFGLFEKQGASSDPRFWNNLI